MRLYPLSKYKGNDFLRNNSFCNNLLSLSLRYFFVLPSYYIQSFIIDSPLFLHRNDGQSMDNLWTIYGQISNEERRKSEGRAKEEQRKNRLVALKDFAQFVECLQVVYIQFSSPAHITMLSTSRLRIRLCGGIYLFVIIQTYH